MTTLGSLLWGTYGKYRELPLTWKPVTDLATDHIIAIMVTQQPIPERYTAAFIEILKDRGYKWVGPKRTEWCLWHLQPFFHAPGWSARNTHHPYPGTATPEQMTAEAACKKQFYSMLSALIEGPMFALELK